MIWIDRQHEITLLLQSSPGEIICPLCTALQCCKGPIWASEPTITLDNVTASVLSGAVIQKIKIKTVAKVSAHILAHHQASHRQAGVTCGNFIVKEICLWLDAFPKILLGSRGWITLWNTRRRRRVYLRKEETCSLWWGSLHCGGGSGSSSALVSWCYT